MPAREGGGRTERPSRPWLGAHRPVLRRLARPLLRFLEVEASSGIVLAVAAAVALVWANSPWRDAYEVLWSTELRIAVGGFELNEDLRHWVNDGLMVLFFFVVGLEIKSEITRGELSDPRRAAIPIAAAAGGMVVPAAVYVVLNVSGGAVRGWGVPMATDIAFAVGLFALLGRRVPDALKVLLLALAIVDDIGAIAVIALFYTDDLSLPWLAIAAGLIGVVLIMRRFQVWYVPVYVLVGAGVWLATFESGVHATIAGVTLGLIAPARPLLTGEHAERLRDEREDLREQVFAVRESTPIAERLQSMLHPWTGYVIVPLFALANAGLTFGSDVLGDALSSPVTLGVALGLVLGKPAGVLGATWLATRLRLGRLPDGVSWRQMLGMGAVAGIGFTMSLFISNLAFSEGTDLFEEAKLGILAASVVAAAIGTLILVRDHGRRS